MRITSQKKKANTLEEFPTQKTKFVLLMQGMYVFKFFKINSATYTNQSNNLSLTVKASTTMAPC